MKSLKAKVISNAKIAPNYYRMALGVGAVAKRIKPGQFFNIRCSDGLNPLLRRPFSMHRTRNQKPVTSNQKKDSVEILYKAIGGGTVFLSKRKKGDLLDIIGPLGNGFSLRGTRDEGRGTILVAGGIGVAPLLALAESISRNTQYAIRNTIIGAKTKKEILCEKDFKTLDFEVSLATEDGSKGKKALATDLLKSLLRNTRYAQRTTIYACGPNAMLREVAKVAKVKKIRAFGSFEEHMACGVGSCYGCVIKTRNGYKRVCKDGPIFDLGEITW